MQHPQLPVEENSIAAGENQQWWGYMTGASSLSSVGIGAADTYHCAMFLPGDHDIAGGKTLCAVRFYLAATHVSNVKVWTAAKLPTAEPSTANTLWLANVDASETGTSNPIDVALTTPYDIPSTGVYVGYTFTITAATTSNDQYPVVIAGTDQPNALLLRTTTNIPSWQDLYGQGFAPLAVEVLLQGEFPQNAVSPRPTMDNYYAQVGQTADIDLLLTNNGQAAVSSIGYTVTADGQTSDEQTLTLPAAIAPSGQAAVSITVNAAATASEGKRTITITKVNGNDNESKKAACEVTLYTMDRLIPRNVVVEEFTGTGCGWCPRGLVGMEKLRQTFGDRFIGIGIHRYNTSDAMYIANYTHVTFTGAPSCRLDRSDAIDPYYGTANDVCDDFRTEMNKPAMAEVKVGGELNEAETEVTATAIVEPLFDATGYKVEFVLVADGLSGTTTAWAQSNYYYSQTASSQPEDLRIFCSGGKYGKSNVTGWTFNDVAIATSYNASGVNQVEALGSLSAGEKGEVSYTLALPTKATLRNAVKKGTVYVVAIVVDADGNVVNAAKREVGDIDDITGIGSTAGETANLTTPTFYSLGGTMLSAPQRGINIVRMGDGTVRKVAVK